jgi:hypothetical protein
MTMGAEPKAIKAAQAQQQQQQQQQATTLTTTITKYNNNISNNSNNTIGMIDKSRQNVQPTVHSLADPRNLIKVTDDK